MIRFAFESAPPQTEASERNQRRTVLRRLSAARFFDHELAESCLLSGLESPPSMAELITWPGVEALPGPGKIYRLESSARESAYRTWWQHDPDAARSTKTPKALRTLSKCLAGQFEQRGEAQEQLYHLVAANQKKAAALFRHLYEQAEQAFDLPQCHALLQILDERKILLGQALKTLWAEKRQRLETWSMWAPEYYETIVYFERPLTRRLIPDLIAGQEHWVLHLFALGGRGITIVTLPSSARDCVPHGIPCARIDFDFVPHMIEAAREPWRLLLRIADQLNRQLPKR